MFVNSFDRRNVALVMLRGHFFELHVIVDVFIIVRSWLMTNLDLNLSNWVNGHHKDARKSWSVIIKIVTESRSISALSAVGDLEGLCNRRLLKAGRRLVTQMLRSRDTPMIHWVEHTSHAGLDFREMFAEDSLERDFTMELHTHTHTAMIKSLTKLFERSPLP